MTALATRALHLIDPENLAGGAGVAEDVIRDVWDCYRAAVPIGPDDHVIVASSSHFARRAWFVFPADGIQRRVRDGADGADLALLESIDLDHDSRRFGTLVIGSGDGIFTDLALCARFLGMQVHQVSGVATPSGQLLSACPRRSRLKVTASAVRLAA
jgi:hypothetical protein